tara:strand:+ start:4935 stop:6908 length:1974 start_codon:yes stop_codon:yes gene_type:complete
MRNLIFLALFFFFNFNYSQNSNLNYNKDLDPVKWDFIIDKDSIITLTFIAKIDSNWHLYSQFIDDEPPLSTKFNFNNAKSLSFIDEVYESEAILSYDSLFEKKLKYFEEQAIFKQRINFSNSIDIISGTIDYQACDDKLCIFRSEPFVFNVSNKTIKSDLTLVDSLSKIKSNQLKLNFKLSENLIEISNSDSGTSSLNIFFLGLLGGLLALLTPCIFPMIPITISYFMNSIKNTTRGIINSFIYSFFIVLIYILLSLPFHFIESLEPTILNIIATNVTVNIIFFFVFVYFAFSFFGFYDITLPTKLTSLSDSASDYKGIIGIFFMALTLSIVSFSCTGPILGSLLAGSITSDAGAIQLTYGMLGFGVALSLPFGLISLFPNILKSFPKSGQWINSIKIVLGFLELALALKFLSNADLVSHWGILKREVFISIWALISILTSLYLFGIYRFPNEIKQKINVSRKIIGAIFFIFSIYLIQGIFYSNNLKLLSGFSPPIYYSLNSSPSECPLNLNCYKDFNKGKKIAEKLNKPILIDFTGWACINCRRMEENVWSNPEVYQILKNQIVLISLYVDDRTKLSEEDQFNLKDSRGSVKLIKTIGQKWSAFQYLNFKTASQPFYVLLDNDNEMLNTPIQYADTKNFKEWLENGINNFEDSLEK